MTQDPVELATSRTFGLTDGSVRRERPFGYDKKGTCTREVPRPASAHMDLDLLESLGGLGQMTRSLEPGVQEPEPHVRV